MKFTINGFVSSQKPTQQASPSPETLPAASAPRKSVVQVRFPGWDKGLAYYNDQFEQHLRQMVQHKLLGFLRIIHRLIRPILTLLFPGNQPQLLPCRRR